MFARKVTAILKPNGISRLSLLTEQQIFPMLRNQFGLIMYCNKANTDAELAIVEALLLEK